MNVKKSFLALLTVCMIVQSSVCTVSAEGKYQWISENALLTISADPPDGVSETLPVVHAKPQSWHEESVSIFKKCYLIESQNTPECIELDEGFALLFDPTTLESLVFLKGFGASVRYMNGRAETCY